jgi:hypothetical protein
MLFRAAAAPITVVVTPLLVVSTYLNVTSGYTYAFVLFNGMLGWNTTDYFVKV